MSRSRSSSETTQSCFTDFASMLNRKIKDIRESNMSLEIAPTDQWNSKVVSFSSITNDLQEHLDESVESTSGNPSEVVEWSELMFQQQDNLFELFDKL